MQETERRSRRLPVVASVAGVALALATALAVSASSPPVDVHGASSLLDEGFVQPLVDRSIPIEVTETCRYEIMDGDTHQHLDVELRLGADSHHVAEVLSAAGVVVDGGTVQQFPGRPADGWNGGLRADTTGSSSLGLVFNNVSLSDGDLASGWAETCPSSP